MNNPTAEIDNLIRRIDDELLILQDAPRLKNTSSIISVLH